MGIRIFNDFDSVIMIILGRIWYISINKWVNPHIFSSTYKKVYDVCNSQSASLNEIINSLRRSLTHLEVSLQNGVGLLPKEIIRSGINKSKYEIGR